MLIHAYECLYIQIYVLLNISIYDMHKYIYLFIYILLFYEQLLILELYTCISNK